VPINEGCPADCANFQTSPSSSVAICSPYQGNKVCIVNDQLSYVLVVSVPETDTVSPGLTFVLTPSSAAASNGVLIVPPATFLAGAYLATQQVAMTVNRYTYNPTGDTALPVQVTFFPQYQSLDAASIGLPLLPIEASTSASWTTEPNGQPDPLASTSFNVGHTSPPLGWVATVPDTPSSGETYVRQVAVNPPFDDSFPPDISDDYANPDDVFTATLQNQLIMGLSAPSSLDGWQVYIQDGSSRRVSNLVTVHGATLSGAPQLFTTQPIPPSGWSVVVQPTDPTMPTFIDSLLGGPINIPYPSLPPSVHVAGTVTPPTPGQNAGATLVFQSYKLDVVGAAGLTSSLNYQATVSSDAASGTFKVTLPKGIYDVTVTPDDPTLPKFVDPKVTIAASLPVQVPPPAHVSGTCLVADGRPLAFADVVLTPAVGLASGVTTPPPTWTLPRPIQTTTDAKGFFNVGVDQGAYDVTVKPVGGSYLPWIVPLTSYSVSKDLPITDCIIPAPVLESVTLEDATMMHDVVPFAVVRAYSRHKNTPSDPSYHEIGSGITDANGRLDLFLTSLP
jgi:hypothetical protein